MLGSAFFLTTVFLASAIISVLFSRLVINLSYRWGFLDFPDGKLKCHNLPVPPSGGLSILAALVVILAIAGLCFQLSFINYFLAILPFFVIGALDDAKFNLSPMIRLMIQVVFAIFMIIMLGNICLPLFKVAALVFLIVAAVNAFNLIDVSDGLSSSVGLTSVVFVIGLLLLSKALVPLIIAVSLAGAIVGFLPFNWPNARAYLGDSGAWLIGSTIVFCMLSIPFSFIPNLATLFLVTVIILGVPFAELVGLTGIRLYLKRSPLLGSPHHFSMFLKEKGFSTAQVNIFAIGSSVVLGICGTVFFLQLVSLLPLMLFLSTSYIIWCWLVYKARLNW